MPAGVPEAPEPDPDAVADQPLMKQRCDPLARVLELGLVAVILLAPLPAGSVNPGARLGLELGALLLGLVWLARTLVHRTTLPSRTAVIGLLGLLALGAVQITPLGQGVVSMLSPESVRIRESVQPPPEVVSAETRLLGVDPAGLEQPAVVSVDAASTASALRVGCALAALFFVAWTVVATCGAGRIALSLLISGALQGLYGLLVLISGHDRILFYTKVHYLDSATGTFVNKNHFAGFLAMALACGAALVLHELRGVKFPRTRKELGHFFEGERSRGLLLGLLLLVGLAGLLASFSRAGIALGLAALLITVFLGARSRALRARAIIAVLLVAIPLVPLMQIGAERLVTRYSEAGADFTSAGGRARVWQDSLGMAAAFPLLGTGWGTFAEAYPMYRSPEVRFRFLHAHNDLLQALTEGGIVGLIFLTLLLAPLLRRIVESLVGGRGLLGVGVAAALSALLLHSLIDFNLRIPANAAVAAILAGCLMGLPCRTRN